MSMPLRVAALVVLAAAAAGPAAAGAAGGGSCVECHRKVEGVAYLEHNFADWENSVHAQAGIGCELCHGGDPSAEEKKAAHLRVVSSRDESSKLYFTRVPGTCGECHESEFKAFRESAHHSELKRSGRGPNCVTCHGSMANRVMSPRDLEMTCTLCHRRPTRAYATLLALNNAASSLDRLRKALASAERPGLDVSSQRASYEKAKEIHARALVDWHTFRMEEVLSASQETTRRATEALNEIGVKRMRAADEGRK